MALTFDIEKDNLYLEGIEKGQRKKAIETAENCLKEGMSFSLTSKVTGLSQEEVLQIAKRLGIR
jgi:MoaA/NifB/PqqE/SkfB family radical SAM enzyme